MSRSLSIRHTAAPVGGALASLSLPFIVAAGGLRAAFTALAALSAFGALSAALLMRSPPSAPSVSAVPVAERPPALDPRIWRLGFGSALLISAQAGVTGYLVVFLHAARGLPIAPAAGLLAAAQLLGGASRIMAGRRSDRDGRRIAPMCRIAARNTALLVVVAIVAEAPGPVLYPILLFAAVSTMSWNGLASAAAGEIAGHQRAGTAMSLQNMLALAGSAAAPVTFGALVEATSWRVAFGVLAAGPLCALLLLNPLKRAENAPVVASGVGPRSDGPTPLGRIRRARNPSPEPACGICRRPGVAGGCRRWMLLTVDRAAARAVRPTRRCREHMVSLGARRVGGWWRRSGRSPSRSASAVSRPTGTPSVE